MKRSQWFTFAIILFIGGMYLLNYGAYSLSVGSDAGYIRAGIYGAFGQTLMLLGFAFGICGFLEEKNLENDVPKKHREVMKLALLEREVDNLKYRLKKEGKIKT